MYKVVRTDLYMKLHTELGRLWYIEYLVSLYSSLHSYDKQFTSYLVHLYDFYYSLVVKGRLTHSFAALTRSFNDLSQLVNKIVRTHQP